MATYGVFGWLFTIYRVITSVLISLIAGLLTLVLVRENDLDKHENSSNHNDRPAKQKPLLNTLDKNIQLKPARHLDYTVVTKRVVGRPININIVKAEERMNIFQKILSYAFDEIYRDIARSFMIGVIFGALIVTFIPENLAQYISSNPLFNYVLVLAVSVPLYVCATASIPLGLSLLSAGFSPGAAFIFLTAGPATNTITMSVVLKTLGKQSLVIYLGSVIIGSLIFGFFFDSFFADGLAQIKIITEQEEALGFVSQVSSVILLYLSLKYIVNKNARLIKTGGSCSGGDCCNSGS